MAVVPGLTVDTVARLVDKSVVASGKTSLGSTRYRLLETVREYALERLSESGAELAIFERHAACFLALAEAAEPQLEGGGQVEWLARLEREHDNIRAALKWFVEQADPEKGLRLSAALWRFWYMRGHFKEGRWWHERALGMGGDVSPAVRAKALNAAGMLTTEQSDFSRARDLYERSLALRDLLVNRLAMYCLVHTVRRQPFLERVMRTWQALFESTGGQDQGN